VCSSDLRTPLTPGYIVLLQQNNGTLAAHGRKVISDWTVITHVS